MFSLFFSEKKNRVRNFSGGIQPDDMKRHSARVPLRTASVPEMFIVPLRQHSGPAGELLVKAGEQVLKGQPLTHGWNRCVPVHSPASGTVSAIAPHITAHPSGSHTLCVHIKPDGLESCYPQNPVSDYAQLDSHQLLERIHLAGIVGLGGAGFPTAEKLKSAAISTNTLIINAAESEPYITSDDRLIQEYAGEIVQGIDILAHILHPKQILIGIEDNKPEAITALSHALGEHHRASLRVIPTRYPSGSARQLTKILTGREVPNGCHSSAIGVLMQNVATVLAIKRAIIDGQPLTERVITLTGSALSAPCNVWARIGTPVRHLLNMAGFKPQAAQKIVMGGPLMGFALPSLDVPVIKTSNCLLVPELSETGTTPPEQPCIRCGLCADVCPAGLLPQQLYWFSKSSAHENARAHHLFDCIECGACAWVCPSHIPLVHYYRHEKTEIRVQDEQQSRSAAAKVRFEARQQRLDQEKLNREKLTQQRSQQAMDPAQHGTTQSDESFPHKAAVAAAIARVKAKKLAHLSTCSSNSPDAADTSSTTVSE